MGSGRSFLWLPLRLDEGVRAWSSEHMRNMLAAAALFTCLSLGHGQEMFNPYEIRAREFAASTGHPYELCLKALQVAAWCQANPQGGVVNGQFYDAQATAAQLAEALKFLTPKPAARPAAPAPVVNTAAVPPIGSNGLANRPAVPVGRNATDPQRMAEQRARQQRQNDSQGGGGGGGAHSFRFVVAGSFAGFPGNYSFRLDNGSVWTQTDGVTTQHNPAIMNPTFVLTTNADGTQGLLEVVGVTGRVQVQSGR